MQKNFNIEQINPIVIDLLHDRGYRSEKEIAEFLSIRPQKTYDPFLLLNMAEGVDLVLSAVENEERICIYGDYDADGVTSTSILLEFLSNMTSNLSYYIPSRFDEGYGLNKAAMKKISESGAALVITVDCGSVSREEVDYGKSLGLQILVTDHHRADEERLPNCPVINPNQPDCNYPFKGLAGCGVAFKLAQAIARTIGMDSHTYNDTLDLVAVGTIADVMPLVDENRTLVKYGLMKLNSASRKQLKTLVEEIGLKLGEVSAFNVAFGIAPHINAVGRIKSAGLGVKLFRSDSEDEISEIVRIVKDCNIQRKNLQNEIYERCIEIIKKDYKKDGKIPNFILIELDNAHEGVTGIVAGRLKEKFHRPVAILTKTEDELYKGTSRSIDGLDIHLLLSHFSDLFKSFGGHKAACGFTIAEKNILCFHQGIDKYMSEELSKNPELLTRKWNWDLSLAPEDITIDFADSLSLFEPCGRGNERPKFSVEGIISNLKSMGNEGQYRRFQLMSENSTSFVPCVCFGIEQGSVDELSEGARVRAIGSIALNRWNGNVSTQMNVNKIFSLD